MKMSPGKGGEKDDMLMYKQVLAECLIGHLWSIRLSGLSV